MRYSVMVRSTQWRSIPDRPVRSFPFRWIAEAVAEGANLNEKENHDGQLEFYVVDKKAKNTGRTETL